MSGKTFEPAKALNGSYGNNIRANGGLHCTQRRTLGTPCEIAPAKAWNLYDRPRSNLWKEKKSELVRIVRTKPPNAYKSTTVTTVAISWYLWEIRELSACSCAARRSMSKHESLSSKSGIRREHVDLGTSTIGSWTIHTRIVERPLSAEIRFAARKKYFRVAIAVEGHRKHLPIRSVRYGSYSKHSPHQSRRCLNRSMSRGKLPWGSCPITFGWSSKGRSPLHIAFLPLSSHRFLPRLGHISATPQPFPGLQGFYNDIG